MQALSEHIEIDNLGPCLRNVGNDSTLLLTSQFPRRNKTRDMELIGHEFPTLQSNKIYGISTYDFVISFENSITNVSELH